MALHGRPHGKVHSGLPVRVSPGLRLEVRKQKGLCFCPEQEHSTEKEPNAPQGMALETGGIDRLGKP